MITERQDAAWDVLEKGFAMGKMVMVEAKSLSTGSHYAVLAVRLPGAPGVLPIGRIIEEEELADLAPADHTAEDCAECDVEDCPSRVAA